MNVVQPDNLTNARSGKPNISAILPYNPGPSALTSESNFFQACFPLKFTPIGTGTTTPNNAQTPAGSEAIIGTFGRDLFAVQVSGTFVGTVLLEGSLDGVTWTQVDTFTTSALRQYSGLYYNMRLSISAYTSGAPLVSFIMQKR